MTGNKRNIAFASRADRTVLKWLISIVVLLTVASMAIYSHYSTRDLIEENRIRAGVMSGDLREEIRQLRFCVAHAITECDDEAIAAWNEANQDNQFVGKTAQEITEAAIEKY